LFSIFNAIGSEKKVNTKKVGKVKFERLYDCSKEMNKTINSVLIILENDSNFSFYFGILKNNKNKKTDPFKKFISLSSKKNKSDQKKGKVTMVTELSTKLPATEN